MKQRQSRQKRRSLQFDLFQQNGDRPKWSMLPQECQRELTSLVAQLMTTLLVDDENVVDGQPVVSGQDGGRYE